MEVPPNSHMIGTQLRYDIVEGGDRVLRHPPGPQLAALVEGMTRKDDPERERIGCELQSGPDDRIYAATRVGCESECLGARPDVRCRREGTDGAFHDDGRSRR